MEPKCLHVCACLSPRFPPSPGSGRLAQALAGREAQRARKRCIRITSVISLLERLLIHEATHIRAGRSRITEVPKSLVLKARDRPDPRLSGAPSQLRHHACEAAIWQAVAALLSRGIQRTSPPCPVARNLIRDGAASCYTALVIVLRKGFCNILT